MAKSDEPTEAKQIELADAKVVERAAQLVIAGDLQRAEKLLHGVIVNAPSEYDYIIEDEESISIKFWDLGEFLHHSTWKGKKRTGKPVQWLPSAYPKAFYYLGFICVQKGLFAEAIRFLDRGKALEPSNPKLDHEKALALVRMGELDKALAIFNGIGPLGPHTNGNDLARALRGKGFVLIELGKLDEAERAFRKSQQYDPESEVARNELDHIENLRQDARTD